MNKEQLYEWLKAMNDDDISDIEEKLASIESRLDALNVRIEIIVRQLPTWSK